MRQEHGFLEHRVFVPHAHGERHAAQRAEFGFLPFAERQRHQTRADAGEPESELLGETVAEIARSKLGKRQAAGGDDE